MEARTSIHGTRRLCEVRVSINLGTQPRYIDKRNRQGSILEQYEGWAWHTPCAHLLTFPKERGAAWLLSQPQELRRRRHQRPTGGTRPVDRTSRSFHCGRSNQAPCTMCSVLTPFTPNAPGASLAKTSIKSLFHGHSTEAKALHRALSSIW